MSPDKQFIAWLNNTYALEKALEQVLENHAKDARDHPQMHQRIAQHIEETREHEHRLEECLRLLGTTPSATKSAIGVLFGAAQAPSTSMYRDEMVKNCLADYASEQFEIAAYRALITAAEALGKNEIATLCQETLHEEEAMATWLAQQIPIATRMTLQEAAAV